MKVLHIFNELNPSGGEVMIKEASSFFQAAGLTSIVLSTGETEGVYAENLRVAGYEICLLPFRENIKFCFEFIRLIKRNGIEVVHLHSERVAFWCGFLAKLAGARIVIRTFHNVFQSKGKERLKRILQRNILSTLGVKMC